MQGKGGLRVVGVALLTNGRGKLGSPLTPSLSTHGTVPVCRFLVSLTLNLDRGPSGPTFRTWSGTTKWWRLSSGSGLCVDRPGPSLVLCDGT